MKWYIAKLVFRVICCNGNHKPQFDEQLRMLKAEDDLHAFHKARLIGEETVMPNNLAPVNWKFIDVIELYSITDYNDGSLINSFVSEECDSLKYIELVKKQANQLLQQSLQQFTALN